jgi:acetylornithine deacetylase/succinyl-diaminopimelate desuccinylase-like protein
MRIAASLLLLANAAAAQQPYTVNWGELRPEIVHYFTQLIRIDTSNPPGNETKAAKAIQALLQGEGIAASLFAADPARANLVARVKGDGSKRPILLLGHTDVVGVQRDHWSVDPFAAIQRNGVIYGRGTVDDKDHVVAGMMILLLLNRLHVKLSRDVIFLAEAGEEGASAFGIDYMIREHWPAIEAEYALAEGGSTVGEDGRVHHVLITTTEKTPLEVRLVARGPASHGSRPTQDNAVLHLARAVAKVGSWQTPVRINETTRAYFERLALISVPSEAARYRAILDPARAAEADRYFEQYEPGHYSMIRTSVAPTEIHAGFRANVIPAEASANLDIRALPDEDLGKFLAALRRVVNDPAVEVIPPKASERPASAPSRIDNEMFRALERVGKEMFAAPTLPGMLTGATDAAQLRAKGVECYGYGPIVTAGDGLSGGAHADDEHIALSSLERMIEFLWKTVIEVATGPGYQPPQGKP